ncbi:MAG TPA: hypothetical protein VHF02_00205 [Luteimonas sp.]|nr:hypothetical protein [Luteimonas sp.]
MKRLLLISLLSAVAFAAAAQSPAPTSAEPADLRAADAANDASVKPFCLHETGSLITASQNRRLAEADKKCAPVAGRSYSRRDIELTGAIDLADALRHLDPAIH